MLHNCKEIMSNILLRAERLSKHYFLGDQKIMVLKDISLTINKGEFVVIAGSSGSGKTTLLSVLSGLDRPSSGRITYGGSRYYRFDRRSTWHRCAIL